MNKRDGYFVNDDTIMIDGYHVRVPDHVSTPGKGTNPSYGYRKRVITPWGSYEMCTIMTVVSLSGYKEKYAHCYKPKTNPYVSFCTFRLTE